MAVAVRDDVLERLEELRERALAADERGVQAPCDAGGACVDGEEPVGRDRHGLALQLEGPHRFADDGIAYQSERRAGDQFLAGCGGLLQTRGHVHRVTRDERLPSAGLAGDDFARVDADPTDERRAVVALELLIEESERFPHVARGANGPEGVVLVGGGDAEDGHHRIADELLHGAAMAFDRLGHRCEVPRHHPPDRLGVQSVPERRRARDVAEDHRDGLPDLPGHGRCRLGEGAATCVAEPSSVWVLDTAVGAGSHGRPSLEA